MEIVAEDKGIQPEDVHDRIRGQRWEDLTHNAEILR
jgi:hypothetical protein